MSDTTNKFMVEVLQANQPIKQYSIDVEKIETVRDLALIFESAGLCFTHWHQNFKKIEHLLKEVKHEP